MVKKINDKKFIIDDIDNMNSNDALNYLMSNKGIGEKVSSCILLSSVYEIYIGSNIIKFVV